MKISPETYKRMAARIGRRKAQLYANRHKSNKRQELENFFRGK